MPSFIIGNPLASGPQIVISGDVFSGHPTPAGGVQIRLHPNASGNVYYGFSGGLTLNSGGFFLSGTLGPLDGMILAPGDAAFIPKLAIGPSGTMNIYFRHDAACSGQARIYWEAY